MKISVSTVICHTHKITFLIKIPIFLIFTNIIIFFYFSSFTPPTKYQLHLIFLSKPPSRFKILACSKIGDDIQKKLIVKSIHKLIHLDFKIVYKGICRYIKLIRLIVLKNNTS